MKYFLNIDTSTDTSTVAIGRDEVVIAAHTNKETRNHAGILNNMIERVLEEAGLTLSAIEAVSVCGGPGSYTGLRIGLATAKGICYALDKPLMVHNRLTLLSYQNYLHHSSAVSVYVGLLLAREKEYFISIYNNGFECTLEPQHINEAELKNVMRNFANIQIITNVAQDVINELNINQLQFSPDIEIKLESWFSYTLKQYNCNNIVNLSLAEPFYLKKPFTHNSL